MTRAEFNNMSLQARSEILLEWGYFVTKKQRGAYNLAVFILNNFFVEVLFQRAGTRIVSVQEVTEKNSLDEYLADLEKHSPYLAASCIPAFSMDRIYKVHPFI